MLTSPPKASQKPKKISMQTIAQKAGVSITTVSLALRDHYSISDDTKNRIVEIQKDLGYQFSGRRAKAKQPYRPNLEQIIYRTVGLDMREDNYAPFLAGVVAECRQRAIKLELDSVPISEFNDSDPVVKGSVPKCGVIITGRVTDRDVEELEQSGLPYILLGNYYLKKPLHMVGINLVDASERAMRDLVNEGSNKVVFFVESKERPYEREFLRLLRGTLFDLGVTGENVTIIEGGEDFRNIRDAADEVTRSASQPGCRVVALERHCAETLTRALRSTPGKTVPPQIVSFVTSTYHLAHPEYRTFNLGVELCGGLAVARLTELQRSPDIPVNSSYIRSPGWV